MDHIATAIRDRIHFACAKDFGDGDADSGAPECTDVFTVFFELLYMRVSCVGDVYVTGRRHGDALWFFEFTATFGTKLF